MRTEEICFKLAFLVRVGTLLQFPDCCLVYSSSTLVTSYKKCRWGQSLKRQVFIYMKVLPQPKTLILLLYFNVYITYHLYDNLKTAEEVYQGQDFISFFWIKSSISGRSKLIINHVL